MQGRLALAVGGGVLVGALAVGTLAFVDHDAKVSTASAQSTPDPTTSDPTTDPTAATNDRRTITVDAVGTVSGVPDVVTINLGVRVTADSARAALSGANDKATALIATLKQAGVADVDITTSDVGVWPQYSNDGRQITGYQATNGVNAKLRDLSKAGQVIDTAASAVGDAITMGGVSFSIDDTGPLYAKAREMAVQQARAHAEQLAKAANVGLGNVIAIAEGSPQSISPYPVPMAAGAATADRVPLQPGSQQVQLTVRVTFAIA